MFHWVCVIAMLYFTGYLIAVLALLPAITVNGLLNFYMNETEAKRVLGLNGNFYFIRDGQVKNNAVLFNMRVPSAVKCLGFTWFRGLTSPVTYSITVESLNPNLLHKPVVKMEGKTQQNTGHVPQRKSGFCVRMECKGTIDGTAEIWINMTLSEYTKSKFMAISLRRTKTCRKVLPLTTSPDVSSNVAGAGKTDSSFSASEKTKVFYIAVGVACSIIFIIALAVAAIHVHSMPSASTNKDSTSPILCSGSDGSSGQSNGPSKPTTAMENTVHTALLEQTPQIAVQQPNQQTTVNHLHSKPINTQAPPGHNPPPNHIPVQVEVNHPHQHNPMLLRTNQYMPPRPFPATTLHNGDIPSATSRTHSISSSVTAPMHNASVSSAPSELYPHAGGLTSTQKGKYGNRDIKAELAPLDVDLDRITLGDLLYEGTFARIYEGVLTGPEEHQQQSVLVKTVSEIASSEQVNLMLIESSMLRDLTHKNLMPIMSVCLEDEKQPLVMFPFMNRGNLKLFLKKSRSPEGLSKSITTADLVQMGIQIAKGMQYLARRKIVHKDLAARNCFLDDELNVKVTDCALSRDLFPGDYCCLCDNENRPVKWMAVESLECNRYTVASDVWAYGVLLWELMTLAQQPYASIDAFEMLAFLKKGHRIAQPLNCPDELFTVIACCWALSEDERPSFGQLIACLTEFNNALSNFV